MKEINRQELWDSCKAFHGHECPGLAIGFSAALYAMKLLDCGSSEDEEIVCVTENDACGVDAIQVLLSCTAGKGNLLFHMTGKSAYSFFDRRSGKSFRLLLKPHESASREEALHYYRDTDPEQLFDVMDVRVQLPETARIFRSVICDGCGEKTAENHIRLENGRKLCPDCFKKYTRPLL
ncbi:MAG: TraR/DksA C4-type zinc finger protein [Solobacterium sp.]|nr:TraR/DksA C4-type zinc finger protein [Solobacterium sp.]